MLVPKRVKHRREFRGKMRGDQFVIPCLFIFPFLDPGWFCLIPSSV